MVLKSIWQQVKSSTQEANQMQPQNTRINGPKNSPTKNPVYDMGASGNVSATWGGGECLSEGGQPGGLYDCIRVISITPRNYMCYLVKLRVAVFETIKRE
jgi:hypothetical protein